MEPRVDLWSEIYMPWDDFHGKFASKDIVLLLVLDGARNPEKLQTNMARELGDCTFVLRWMDSKKEAWKRRQILYGSY